MKKFALYILIAAVIGVSVSFAQNNTPWSTAGSIGIGTTTPGRTLDVFGQARATYLWAGQIGANQDGRLYITDSTGNTKIYLGGYPTESSYFASGNVGIGTTSPVTLLQVAGPITAGAAGGSTSGVDYFYGNYGNGKLFVLGSQYSSAASFLGYAVKAQPGATGYLSSTGITLGRASIEANNGYISFLTGVQQASSDGGVVSITEKMRVDALGNVGVGTSIPGSTKMRVVSATDEIFKADDGSTAVIRAKADGTVTFEKGNIGVGTAIPGATKMRVVSTTDEIFKADDGSTAVIRAKADGTVTFEKGNVGIGTNNPTQKLSVNGTIRAKEVVVETTGWSDYVFSTGYSLEPLSAVEIKIKEQGHLPGIPSTREVAERGVSLGEMQAKLLAKIEELTLHAIKQEKRIEQLESEVKRLSK